MRRRVVCILATAVAIAFCYLKSYDISPTHYSLSGWVTDTMPPDNWVGETFIANFDSAAEVQFFVGDVGNPGNTYDVDIYEYPDGIMPVANSHGVVAPKGHTWLRFPMTPYFDQKIVRGQEYKVVVTRPNGQINWYRDTTNAYAYGHMEGGGSERSIKDDLCMKLFGKARIGDEFATQSNVAWKDDAAHETIPFDTPANWDACIRREVEVGVKYDKIGYGFWPLVQRSGPGQFVWGWLDTLMTSFANHGIRPIMAFRGTPAWATCAYSTTGQPNGGAIPRGLYEPVIEPHVVPKRVNPDNYYAKYIYEFVRRYGPKGYAFNDSLSGTFWRDNDTLDTMYIRLFEGYAEVPDGGLGKAWDTVYDHRGGYWRLFTALYHPDSLVDPVYRETLASYIPQGGSQGDTLAGRKSSLASVYARLMVVVDSAVKLACEQRFPTDPAPPMSVAYVSDDGWYGMNDWLTRLKSYRRADTCFDVASCWGYAGIGKPEGHAEVLQWVRSWLADAGYEPRPCVFTEFGCTFDQDSPPTDAQRAYHLSKAYPMLEAANATPGYSALQGAWFTFTWQYMPVPHWPITLGAPNFASLPPAYAYQQWSSLTKGADFEGRIPAGDSVFVLQFEDSFKQKFWMAWANPPYPNGQGGVQASIPARSDVIDSMSTQTDSTQDRGSQSCGTDGWLHPWLDTIPLIIVERETLHRPDITVDSVWYTPAPSPGLVVFQAKLRNHGTDSTPTSTEQQYPCTRVRFYIENQQVSQTDHYPSIDVDETVTVSASDTFALPMPLPLLVRATANEEQMYVELGMDDNAGYFKCGSP